MEAESYTLGERRTNLRFWQILGVFSNLVTLVSFVAIKGVLIESIFLGGTHWGVTSGVTSETIAVKALKQNYFGPLVQLRK